MGILDLKTNLKSLRYGKDRPFGGSSNQPYVTRDIDVKDSEVGRTGGPDFLLRGGTLIPRRVANDVSRMTQMFFDLKSPNGILFTAKQNVLALSGTDFKAGPSTSDINVGRSAVGDFLRNNVGFDKSNIYTPLSTIGQTAGGFLGAHLYKQGLNPLNGPETYTKYISDLDSNDGRNSRLVTLSRGTLTSDDPNLFSYIGGPGSVNGIGRTIIKRFEHTDLSNNSDSSFTSYDYTQLSALSDKKSVKGKGDTSILDFRQSEGQSNTKSFNYADTTLNFEGRVKLGNPGVKKPKIGKDYQIGLGTALDKINAMPIYKQEFHNKQGDDFVKFRIGVIDNQNPKEKTFVHFRAILDSLEDNYTAEWNSQKLMGRGEQFYRYNGFTRTVNLSWTVAAQSKQELIPMYQKLNYLASSLTPYYSDTGYMGGNLVSLTLGGWFYEQPGIITGMTLSVPQEAPWEIAIPSSSNGNNPNGGSSDKDVKELPHIIKVTGVQFIPIHKFVPKLQKNTYTGDNGNVSSYGSQRYIALSTGESDGKGGGGNNNYGDSKSGEKINGADNYLPKSSRKTQQPVNSFSSRSTEVFDVAITAPKAPPKKKYKALAPLVGEATIDSNVFDQSTLQEQGYFNYQDDLSGDFS